MTVFNNYKPVRLIELFAGIDAQAKALMNLGVDFERWFVCDFDPNAIESYNAVHNTMYRPCDITKISANDLNVVETDRYTYVLTYSFPCQDLSSHGLGKGMSRGNGTRSGLLWEVERLLNECMELPQVLLMENVPQVHGTNNMADFLEWTTFLNSKGYSNYWKDLNSMDYGIPQSRNRCFMVSILGDYTFNFPQPQPLTTTLLDLLDDVVDERFYSNSNDGTLRQKVYNIAVEKKFLSPGDIIDASYSHARLKEMESGWIKLKNTRDRRVACTLTTKPDNWAVCTQNGRLRKFTPEECWRLMGFDANDFARAALKCDESQLYKQAGNSIVVNVLMAIFKELLIPKKSRSEWLSDLLGDCS